MKTKAIVLVIGVLFLLGASHDVGRCGVDPGVPDTIRVDFISGGFGAGTQLVAEVTIYNDDVLGAVVVPLTFYNKDNPDLVCDSVSFAGGRADYIAYFKEGIINAGGVSHTVNIVAVPIFTDPDWEKHLNEAELAHPIMPGDTRELLAKIYFTTGQSWRSDVEVVLDTITLPPDEGVYFCFVSGTTAEEFVPVFANHQENRVAKPLGVVEVPGATVPKEFSVSQNFPNPFNPETNIRFSVDRPRQVDITIYNILGQQVKTLVSEVMLPGTYEVTWNGTDVNEQRVASGVYLYRVKSENEATTKKMTVVK